MLLYGVQINLEFIGFAFQWWHIRGRAPNERLGFPRGGTEEGAANKPPS